MRSKYLDFYPPRVSLSKAHRRFNPISCKHDAVQPCNNFTRSIAPRHGLPIAQAEHLATSAVAKDGDALAPKSKSLVEELQNTGWAWRYSAG